MTSNAKEFFELELLNKVGEKKCALKYKNIQLNKPVVRSLEYEELLIDGLVVADVTLEMSFFDYAKLFDVHLINIDLFAIIASDIEAQNCVIKDSLIYGCTLYGSIYKQCSFENVAFRGANLAESLFDNCTFQNCKFTSDNINHFTDLTDAKFINCSVVGTIFDDIDINENTVLPIIGKQ